MRILHVFVQVALIFVKCIYRRQLANDYGAIITTTALVQPHPLSQNNASHLDKCRKKADEPCKAGTTFAQKLGSSILRRTIRQF
jgi:hypothetical protein